MEKKVAVIAPNPVNGMGLFTYLETFFENKIPYNTFAIANSPQIKTNSGISINLDGTIKDLLEKADEYAALVFSCGDAIKTLNDQISEPYWQEAIQIMKTFNNAGKLLIGHCAAGLLFEIADITSGKQVSLHPLAKGAIKNGIAVDADFAVDQNLLTAECEHSLHLLMPEILKALKS